MNNDWKLGIIIIGVVTIIVTLFAFVLIIGYEQHDQYNELCESKGFDNYVGNPETKMIYLIVGNKKYVNCVISEIDENGILNITHRWVLRSVIKG